ncbi:hypothetical protein R1sor_000892 [Riccia sorocarpa]|uniref:Reverse transcriptase domain-containing protein n=1 Tax=Riccia sorocarpa TaxID=122646 RepID=A0ABD3GXN6_9MARC
MRAVLRRHKYMQKNDEAEAGAILKKLEEARIMLQDSPTSDNRSRFEEALLKARRREQTDIRICRIRCRIRWLQEEDVSSKFFFACLTAKNAREEISALRLETGEVITDKGRILQLIEKTYSELYTAEPETGNIREARAEILQMMDRKLSSQQNKSLEETPTEELIEETVKSLPLEKSPGFDGVTAEVLVVGWDSMSGDCFRMVRKEESEGRLQGVNYGGERSLMHQIYADDTGLNLTMDENQYARLKEVIQVYEAISGAKLNVSKSLIMPINPSVPPAWVRETGCEVADQENPRASLVAWERITQAKSDGGLGWSPLRDKARAVQIKNLVKVM